jgi:hypothetical protein
MMTQVRPSPREFPGLLLERIRGEFLEMPGLRLTPAQACRLWALDRHQCDDVLRLLVDGHFLRKTSDGSFVRAA